MELIRYRRFCENADFEREHPRVPAGSEEGGEFSKKDVRRKLSDKQEIEITRRYSAGENTTTLAREFNVMPNTIGRIVCRQGGKVRSAKESLKYFDAEEEKKIVDLYIEKHKSSDEIAKLYNVTAVPILAILHRHKVNIRNPQAARRKTPLNQSAFEKITPDSSYWIGFFMADGMVSGRVVAVTLSSVDIFHVVKFRKFIKSGHRVYETKIHKIGKTDYMSKGEFTLSVSSQQMVNDLARFGVVQGKTKRATVKQLEFDPHFWRGVIDGDGSIEMSGSKTHRFPSLQLVGSETLLSQFMDFVRKIYPTTKVKVYPQRNIFRVALGGKPAVAVINALYGDPNVTALDRKMEKAQEILHPEYKEE